MAKPYVANNGKPIFHEFISPVGLVVHLFHDKPQLKTKDQFGKIPDLDANGIQIAEYKVTLAWEKTRAGELNELIQMAHLVKSEGWPESVPTPQNPQPFFALEPFFRDGDNPAHNTKSRDYLFGKYYLNFKQRADSQRTQSGQIVYSGGPGICGPNGGDHQIAITDIFPGCKARASGIMFATEYMGKHFISTRLNNIQLFEQGERIGGGARPTTQSQFGSLVPGATQNALAGLQGLL